VTDLHAVEEESLFLTALRATETKQSGVVEIPPLVVAIRRGPRSWTFSPGRSPWEDDRSDP